MSPESKIEAGKTGAVDDVDYLLGRLEDELEVVEGCFNDFIEEYSSLASAVKSCYAVEDLSVKTVELDNEAASSILEGSIYKKIIQADDKTEKALQDAEETANRLTKRLEKSEDRWSAEEGLNNPQPCQPVVSESVQRYQSYKRNLKEVKRQFKDLKWMYLGLKDVLEPCHYKPRESNPLPDRIDQELEEIDSWVQDKRPENESNDRTVEEKIDEVFSEPGKTW